MRLRVLYLTHHSPWPVTSGGRLRDAALVPHLARHADIEVWAVTRNYDEDRAALTGQNPDFPVRIFRDESRDLDYPTRSSTEVRWLLQRQDLDGRPFDVVHVEGHYLTHLVPDNLAARTLLVEHNVESELIRQLAVYGEVSDAALTAVSEAERVAWSRVARVLVLSIEDRCRVLRRMPGADVHVGTNGADHIPLRAPLAGFLAQRSPSIGFLANYAYRPNQDAVRWLLDLVFPTIQARVPDSRLLLAGSNVDRVLRDREIGPSVHALGWLPDLDRLWEQIDVVICPLRVGGGVKVKMIEAIRGGRLVVSTNLGVEGLPASSRRAVLRADDATEFADQVLALCTDSRLRATQQELVAAAQLLQPSWPEAARQVYQQWTEVHAIALRGSSVH